MLRWALAEGWRLVARPTSALLYRQKRARGKKANTAITIVARRMCRILFQLLKERGEFEKRAEAGADLPSRQLLR